MTTRAQLEALLNAAEMLLAAREAQMLTTDEWDLLEHAVAACVEPPANERTEAFSIDATGALVRSVTPLRGEPYQHRCLHNAFESLAGAIEEATGPLVLEDLRHASDIPWTQAAVAFAFLKERGAIVPAGGRNHVAGSSAPFEDAMVEYHALREKGPGA